MIPSWRVAIRELLFLLLRRCLAAQKARSYGGSSLGLVGCPTRSHPFEVFLSKVMLEFRVAGDHVSRFGCALLERTSAASLDCERSGLRDHGVGHATILI